MPSSETSGRQPLDAMLTSGRGSLSVTFTTAGNQPLMTGGAPERTNQVIGASKVETPMVGGPTLIAGYPFNSEQTRINQVHDQGMIA